MRTGHIALLTILLTGVVCSAWASKAAVNRAYVQSDLDGQFYVRCVPDSSEGESGSTVLYRVRRDGDEIVDRYDWYSRDGVVLGWSPIVGKVALMRKGGQSSPDRNKQHEFSFYLGGEHLKTYTTEDMVNMGANVPSKKGARGKRAEIEFSGCHQVPGSNEYVFMVTVNGSETIQFDILTGEPYKRGSEG